MIKKTERYYTRRFRTYRGSSRKFDEYKVHELKKTTYWIFCIIPIFIKEELLHGN